MTLFEAAKNYLVCGETKHRSALSRKATQDALKHILWFYGKDLPLESLDDSTVLQYIKLFDPFDCDPLHEARGAEYCNFIEWMMKNHLIPAWAGQMDTRQDWEGFEPEPHQQHAGFSAS